VEQDYLPTSTDRGDGVRPDRLGQHGPDDRPLRRGSGGRVHRSASAPPGPRLRTAGPPSPASWTWLAAAGAAGDRGRPRGMDFYSPDETTAPEQAVTPAARIPDATRTRAKPMLVNVMDADVSLRGGRNQVRSPLRSVAARANLGETNFPTITRARARGRPAHGSSATDIRSIKEIVVFSRP
jgi:hypothetical protein